MIKKYKLIVSDTFNVLELNKIYKIKNDRWIVSDDNDSIILYVLTKWMVENMFIEVKD